MPKKLANALGSLAMMAAAHESRTQNQAADDAKWLQANPGKTPPPRALSPIDKGVNWLKSSLTPATPPASALPPAMPAEGIVENTPATTDGEMDANRLFTKQEWIDAPGGRVDEELPEVGNSQGPGQFDADLMPGQ